MNKLILPALSVILSSIGMAQSFAPAAGQPGSTAISKDSSAIVNWASGISVDRGYRDIANPSLGYANFGNPEEGLVAEGSATTVVSLGDGGTATLTFPVPIRNGSGPDFTVFENGFADDYLELAFVEVSSDGVHYVRFPAISEVPTDTQVGPFDYSDCRMVHNLAGKYRVGFGTPFDLEDLVDSSGIDLENITHVRLVDVVGAIDPQYGTTDHTGNLINDLYPTAFESGGFDLDGVAVMHQQGEAGMDSFEITIALGPNPTSDAVDIETPEDHGLEVFDINGRKLDTFPSAKKRTLHLKEYASSIIYLHIQTGNTHVVRKVIVF